MKYLKSVPFIEIKKVKYKTKQTYKQKPNRAGRELWMALHNFQLPPLFPVSISSMCSNPLEFLGCTNTQDIEMEAL